MHENEVHQSSSAMRGSKIKLADERCLRADDTELVPFRVGKYGPRLGARLSDVDPACAERENAFDLGVALLGAASEVEVNTILDDLLVRHRHETDPDRRSLSGADHDLSLPLGEDSPTQHLSPEPGQFRQVVRIDDDVVQPNSHTRQYQRPA